MSAECQPCGLPDCKWCRTENGDFNNRELLIAAKEALSELEPTTSDAPGYYADPKQVERLRTAIKNAEKIDREQPLHYRKQFEQMLQENVVLKDIHYKLIPMLGRIIAQYKAFVEQQGLKNDPFHRKLMLEANEIIVAFKEKVKLASAEGKS